MIEVVDSKSQTQFSILPHFHKQSFCSHSEIVHFCCVYRNGAVYVCDCLCCNTVGARTYIHSTTIVTLIKSSTTITPEWRQQCHRQSSHYNGCYQWTRESSGIHNYAHPL